MTPMLDLGALRSTSSRDILERAFDRAGIRVDGPNPWDLRVHDERFFDRVLTQGTLGLGESYMDGWWDCAELDELIARTLRHRLKDHLATSWQVNLAILRLRLINLQSQRLSRRVAEVHYDLGNDF